MKLKVLLLIVLLNFYNKIVYSSTIVNVTDGVNHYGVLGKDHIVNVTANPFYNDGEITKFGVSASDAVNTINVKSNGGLILSHNDSFITNLNVETNGTFEVKTKKITTTNLNNSGTVNIGSMATLSGKDFKNSGTLNLSSGYFTFDIYTNNSGKTTNITGGNFTGKTFVNNGTVTARNGNIVSDNYTNNSGSTTNFETGTVSTITNYTNAGTTNVSGGKVTISNSYNNTGTTTISNGEMIAKDYTNTGTTTVNGGKLTINNSLNANGGNINISSGSIVNNNIINVNNGNIAVSGTGSVNNTNGTIKFNGTGKYNGNINNGKVEVNIDYNNGTNTKFGTSTSNSITELKISNSGKLTLSNDSYINNVANDNILVLSDGTLNGNIKNVNVTDNVQINGEAKIKGTVEGGTVYLKTNYKTINGSITTNFGTAANNIEKLVVNDATVTLDLENNSYIKTITNNGTTNFNKGDNSTLHGTINLGTININENYSAKETFFGDSLSNSIAKLNIKEDKTLTLKNDSFITSLTVDSGSTLKTEIRDDLLPNDPKVITITGNIIEKTADPSGEPESKKSIFDIYADETVVNGSIGTSSNYFDNIYINNGKKLTIDSTLNGNNTNVYTDNMLLKGSSSTLATTGNKKVTITGNIYAEYGNKNGNANFGASETIIDGNFGLIHSLLSTERINNINIEDGKDLFIKGSSRSTQNMTYSKKMSLGEDSLLKIGGGGLVYVDFNITNNVGDKYLIVSLKGDKDDENKKQIDNLVHMIGETYDGYGVAIRNDNTLMLNKFNYTALNEGDVHIISEGNYSAYAGTASLTYSSIYSKLSLIVNSTSVSVQVDKNRNPYTSDILSSAGHATGDVIDSWGFGRMDGEDARIVSTVQNIEDETEFFYALNELAPDVSGAVLRTIYVSNRNIFKNVQQRLDNLRFATMEISGIAEQRMEFKQDNNVKGGFWGEIIGGVTNVNEKERIYGYNIMQGGVILGFDNKINNNLTLGISYGFSYSMVNNNTPKSINNDELNISSSNIGLYSMYSNGKSFMNLFGGVTINTYSSERNIKFQNYDETATVSFNGLGYNAGITLGHTFVFDGDKHIRKGLVLRGDRNYLLDMSYNGLTITPNVSFLYSFLTIDKYIENGAGAANLEIETEPSSLLEGTAGLTIIYNKQLYRKFIMQTLLSASATYNIINYTPELTARFQNDTNTFKVKGYEIDPLTYSASIGFYINRDNKSSVGLEYTYSMNEDMISHLGKINFVSKF